MQYTISISTDFGANWTKVETFTGDLAATTARIAVLQQTSPGAYKAEPVVAAAAETPAS